MSKLVKINDRHKSLIRNINNITPCPDPLPVDNLINLVILLAEQCDGVLHKEDFYVIARTLLGEDACSTNMSYTIVFSVLAFGLGHGIHVRDVSEIKIPDGYMRWAVLRKAFNKWRIGLYSARNVASKAKTKRPKTSNPNNVTGCQFDMSILERVFREIAEMRADLQVTTDLVKDTFLAPGVFDVDKEGNETLFHAYKAAVTELSETKKKLKVYESMQAGSVHKRLQAIQMFLAQTVNNTFTEMKKLGDAANMLLDVTDPSSLAAKG